MRYIKGKVVRGPDKALAFCRENGFSAAVVKPIQSAGSQGLFLCDSLDEVEKAVETLLTFRDIYGRPIDRALVQERITGTEYIVNTVSCRGVHALNSVLRYRKEKTAEGGYIYDYSEMISRLEQGHTALVEYAFRVADAIGFQNGILHGEYMIDGRGPVLIEVNCRPMGCTFTNEYLDKIFGQHESDAMLDAYLDPEGFAQRAEQPYRPLRKGAMKHFMIPRDMEAEDHPVWAVAKRLRSTYKISVSDSTAPVSYRKTRDLETSGGIIYLVHDDEAVVLSDLEILRETERKYFSLLFSEGTSRRWFADAQVAATDVDAVIRDCGCHGAILAALDSETEREGAQTVTPQTLGSARGGFDCVIVGYQLALLGLNESACLELVFQTMDLVKPGGRVIIPRSTYEYLSYKREGAELLMRIMGLAIQPPLAGVRGYVVGRKES